MKVKVISLPYIFKVLYVLCFTRPRYQVIVYRTIGSLVYEPCHEGNSLRMFLPGETKSAVCRNLGFNARYILSFSQHKQRRLSSCTTVL